MKGFNMFRLVRTGAQDVLRHKLRSFLTMLGMVFGVGSVVAMLAVGEGASEQALEAIRKLGSRNILISSVKPTETGAEGVGVVIKAKHLCMMMRGVEKQNSEMTTSAVLGSFRTDVKVRQEFMSLL